MVRVAETSDQRRVCEGWREVSRDHLTEVKELIDKYENCYNKEIALNYAQELMRYHAKWAVEQAERVQESGTEIEKREKFELRRVAESKNLRERNKRLREALEEILKESYEEAGVHPDTNMQLKTYIVKIVCKALEEGEA